MSKTEIGPVLLGERDAFVVDQAGVLDGIDARTYGVFDGLRAVSVSGDFAAELVSFFRNGPHLFESELGCAGLIALLRTPPEAQILMRSAPYFTTSRTLARAAQGPSATPSDL